MSTVLSHTAIPLGLTWAFGTRRITPRLCVAGAVASALPDVDVLGFSLGIPYGSLFSHRGFTHSLVFGLIVAMLGALCWRQLRVKPWPALLFLFVSCASHGVLDAMTNGGSGIAFFSPFTNARYFCAWRPLPVPSIGPWILFSPYGLAVLGSEIVYVWLPCMGFGLAGFVARRGIRPRED